jgi:hypothetical protein
MGCASDVALYRRSNLHLTSVFIYGVSLQERPPLLDSATAELHNLGQAETGIGLFLRHLVYQAIR